MEIVLQQQLINDAGFDSSNPIDTVDVCELLDTLVTAPQLDKMTMCSSPQPDPSTMYSPRLQTPPLSGSSPSPWYGLMASAHLRKNLCPGTSFLDSLDLGIAMDWQDTIFQDLAANKNVTRGSWSYSDVANLEGEMEEIVGGELAPPDPTIMRSSPPPNLSMM
ncbi:uncharacterized protein LOC126249602 [Schistocerca nitens]|uniref:uncharacterized protein LOC126249602 n=1 Tax=Schistocerca nitens TaxID=7011 RepID=UPI00211769D6|nr:uncharacterized protein LOC126249602 [Schistocerca nitens]